MLSRKFQKERFKGSTATGVMVSWDGELWGRCRTNCSSCWESEAKLNRILLFVSVRMPLHAVPL